MPASTHAAFPTDDASEPHLPMAEPLRWQLLGGLLESVAGLCAIYHLSDLRVAYLNEAAQARLNPGGQAEVARLHLMELVGVGAWQRLQAEILPQARVLGRWTGELELRDVWGSEFSAQVVLRVHTRTKGESYLCMHAEEVEGRPSVREVHFSDRQLLHALLDHAPDAIYFKDEASRFVRVSRSQAQKFGCDDPRQLIGKTDFDFFTAEHAGAAYADEQAILRSGQPLIDREELETWEDGHETWVSTTKLPLYDAAGKLIGTFGVSHDITARKQAAEDRRELELQLQLAQKLESIGRLAAGVAHEINTPTQFIADNTHFLTDAFAKIETVLARYRALRLAAAGCAGTVCAQAAQAATEAEAEAELDYLTTEIPHCLQQSLDGLARVSRIVGSLKEFAHPNSPELAPADLNRAIETSVIVSRHEWKYVAELSTELDPDLPPVPCVVDEFNQVILNLIVNAAHAIGDALKQRGLERGLITVRTRREGPWAVVEVEDTGTGIPEEIRDRIYEPFFTTKAPGKGTGQGLAIVRTVIVKHHGGELDLRTEPGKGTTFVLRLPLATADAVH